MVLSGGSSFFIVSGEDKRGAHLVVKILHNVQIIFEFSRSRFAVGSSARTIFGLLTIARAIAIRWLCPRKLGWFRFRPISQPPQSRASLIASFRWDFSILSSKRDLHIFISIIVRQQIVTLKNKPDLFRPKLSSARDLSHSVAGLQQ